MRDAENQAGSGVFREQNQSPPPSSPIPDELSPPNAAAAAAADSGGTLSPSHLLTRNSHLLHPAFSSPQTQLLSQRAEDARDVFAQSLARDLVHQRMCTQGLGHNMLLWQQPHSAQPQVHPGLGGPLTPTLLPPSHLLRPAGAAAQGPLRLNVRVNLVQVPPPQTSRVVTVGSDSEASSSSREERRRARKRAKKEQKVRAAVAAAAAAGGGGGGGGEHGRAPSRGGAVPASSLLLRGGGAGAAAAMPPLPPRSGTAAEQPVFAPGYQPAAYGRHGGGASVLL